MKTGLKNANILLPNGCDMEKWSVIACDQYTSDPGYWRETERTVGGAPSTLRLTLPEIFLGREDTAGRVEDIHQTMRDYLARGILREIPDGMIYVRRTLSDGKTRRGIVAALDLEEYDFSPESAALCRATEATVTERIPPRKAVRQNAPLELPHILVLIDDKRREIIEGLDRQTENMVKEYDFTLMRGGGRIKGWRLTADQQRAVQEGLDALRREALEKYGSELLYLVGDGNHSLATAKACWEDLKKSGAAGDHPARYALVEITNLQSEDLVFEPIHRVVTDCDLTALTAFLAERFPGGEGDQRVTLVTAAGDSALTLAPATARLTVGTLQKALDDYLALHPETRIDYVHDDDAARRFAKAPGAAAFLLPAIAKDAFFESISRDGTLPRKTFSMGAADDKRFYLEARRIK